MNTVGFSWSPNLSLMKEKNVPTVSESMRLQIKSQARALRLLRSDCVRTDLCGLTKAGTHIPAPRPTRESAVCRPSYGEIIAAQFSTCKSTHVRTDTRSSWPHRHRYVKFKFLRALCGLREASVMDIETFFKEVRKRFLQ
ncbi:hypothetical protein J6590_014154 [Homalodisca vitripennis]|nr:hypothetical protein J6590_014154 [Homalodisca vitripennis]